VDDIELAPDADAALTSTEGFRVADCASCGGILKPDIVYFGENVPKPRVLQAYRLVDEAEALLVVGSSLTVFSGRRFGTRAAAQVQPVVNLNRGATTSAAVAALSADPGCSSVPRALLKAYRTCPCRGGVPRRGSCCSCR